jgi:hypothetical protein
MVLDSLASIGNLSLQRRSVSIASHWDRNRCGTSLVTLSFRPSLMHLVMRLADDYLGRPPLPGPERRFVRPV